MSVQQGDREAVARPAPPPGLRPLLREVNRRIAKRARGEVAALTCECEDRSCSEAFEVPLPLFRVVDSRPELYLVRPGHERPPVERVLRRERAYLVVQLGR